MDPIERLSQLSDAFDQRAEKCKAYLADGLAAMILTPTKEMIEIHNEMSKITEAIVPHAPSRLNATLTQTLDINRDGLRQLIEILGEHAPFSMKDVR